MGLFAIALPAFAVADVCVQNNTELTNALNAVHTTAKNILIVQGSYNLGSNMHYDTRPDTTIRGGYTANCASRNIAAGNTVLAADGRTQLDIYGDLLLEGLTFQLQFGIDIYAYDSPGAAVPLKPGTTLTIRRDVFQQSGSDLDGTIAVHWYLEDSDSTGGANIVDSLFVENAASAGTCILNLDADHGSPQFQMINDTVYGNTGRGACLINSNGADGSLVAHNNIFFNNTGLDLFANTTNVELVRNTYGTSGGQSPASESGTQHADPKLNANYRPIQSPPSPVINSGESVGAANLSAHDLDGGPRVVGTRVDRGAYETGIDDSFVLTVTTANDSGAGSLRAAINSANANGSGLIGFNIAGDCSANGPFVIHLSTPLPAISSATIISGYSQPGASQNTLDRGVDAKICIVLDGAGIPDAANANGLLVDAGAPATTQLTVLGLGFGGFDNAAINLSGGSAHSVLGSHIGGSIGGVALAPSGWGVYVGSGAGSVVIGGDDAEDRNVIGAAINDGIRIFDTTGSNTVANNYIGLGWNNSTSTYVNRGNGRNGITVSGSDNQIHDNLVGYSASNGIVVNNSSATGNVVEHNYIGRDLPGTLFANGGAGVSVDFGAHDNKFRYNDIEGNAGAGVRVGTGLGNTIRFNLIASNGLLGIDLAGTGVTPNDDDNAPVASSLGNRGLNFPVLSQAIATFGGAGTVQGTMTSTPGDYYIDLYADSCDASGHGEGYTLLDSKKVSIGMAQQSVSFTMTVPAFLVFPSALSAIATDASSNSSPGNTSEFSACVPWTEDRIFANGFDPPPV